MDAVDILIFCVVGFSVLVFLIVDSHEEIRKSCVEADQSRVSSNSESKTGIWSHVLESVKVSDDDQEEENSAKQLISENCKRADFQEIIEEEEEEGEAEIPVDDSFDRSGFCSSGILDVRENTKIDICKNMGVSVCEDQAEEESLDDWEGIERTELEKSFGEAMVFMSCKSNADEIDGDVKLELYGLQKIALEGPCHGSQPMALKVSARAKWNAWQKLGDMSREMAMEKYVNILEEAIPGWKSDFIEADKDARTSED